jgi:hypothetical protein
MNRALPSLFVGVLTLQTYTYEVKALTGELSRKVCQLKTLLTVIILKNVVAMTAMAGQPVTCKSTFGVTAVWGSATMLLLISCRYRISCPQGSTGDGLSASGPTSSLDNSQSDNGTQSSHDCHGWEVRQHSLHVVCVS